MNSYLIHHGILGQKWGIRRFQKKDGTLTEAGKMRYLTDEEKQDVINRGDVKKASEHSHQFSKQELDSITSRYESEKRLKEILKRDAENQQNKKLTDDERKQIIDRADVKTAYKYKREFSKKEIDDVIARYNAEKNLKDISQADVISGKKRIEKITSDFNTVAKLLNSGIAAANASMNAYDTSMKVYNRLKNSKLFA